MFFLDNKLLLIIIPFLYSMMIAIEFISQFSRAAGFFLQKNAIGYSLQNATFTLTRFFYVLLMPLIGLMVDSNLSTKDYLLCVLSSFFLTFLFGLIVYFFRVKICVFYCRVISHYIFSNGLFKSVFHAFRTDPTIDKIDFSEMDKYQFNMRYFFLSCLVYSVHAVGVFATFFIALVSPTNKIMITQTSGVINAFATLLLTFKIDPALSVAIEKQEGFISAFISIFIGRLFVFLLLAPCLMLVVYNIFA